jgi:TolB-like protein
VRYLFKDYSLDIGRRELTCGNEMVSVSPQVFDLLVFLVQNRERVVSKDEVLDAVWSGRIVSESTLTSHMNAVRKAIGDSGEEQSLVRTIPRKGFRFVGNVKEDEVPSGNDSKKSSAVSHDVPKSADTSTASKLSLPGKPSIAVLPFQNLSGDPEQEYFADGVVEDIITEISRMRWLFVIARNSSFTYKGRVVDVKQVGRELGVRYVLEGSVRKSVNRVRIAGQLIDTANGAHLWADRFDGMLEDIFELQDQMTTRVVGAIAPALERVEIERARSKPTESLDAYDYHLHGMASFYRRTRESTTEAINQFCKAIEIDPEFSTAYGMAAQCYCWRKLNDWMSDTPREAAEGARLARQAIELGKQDAIALARGAHSLTVLAGEVETGIECVDRALTLNPNLAVAWHLSGALRMYYGDLDLAIQHLAQAMRLSPLDPEAFRSQGVTALVHLFAGRFDEASTWGERAIRELPSFLPGLTAAAAGHALAGRAEEAGRVMQRLRQFAPAMRASNVKDWLPFRPQDKAILEDGLRKARLPE